MFASILPFLFPAILSGFVIFMSIKEYKNYKENLEITTAAKVKLIRRFIGYTAMMLVCISIAAGLNDINIKKVTLWPWISIIIFLPITVLVGAWDAASEMRKIRKEMKKDCEEEIHELLREYEEKAKTMNPQPPSD